MVTQAVMSIVKSLGPKSVDFLESILPTMLLVIRYFYCRVKAVFYRDPFREGRFFWETPLKQARADSVRKPL